MASTPLAVSAQSSIWVGTWAAAQQTPEPANALAPDEMRDATIREIFHMSVGGAMVRVRLSNAFGTAPLHFTSVHLARPVRPMGTEVTATIDAGTDRALTFAGRPDVTVPAGAEYWSDPIAWPVAALSDVAVSFHLKDPPQGETGHPGSRATTFVAHGDLTGAANMPAAKEVEHWYQVSGIDVQAKLPATAIVALGDSITDGHGSTTNGNDRWADFLAERLQAAAATKNIGVLNEGIGGNHLLTDGLGPNALARLDRDVLAQTGVRWVIVFEGVNDLGDLTQEAPVPAAEHEALVGRVIAAYQQIIARAHAHGLMVIGATITPYLGSDYYHPDESNEADRQAVNRWIREPGHFDAVIDFDAMVRDSQRPDRLLAAYDCGDHLHPSPAGYRAMANGIPLALFGTQGNGKR